MEERGREERTGKERGKDEREREGAFPGYSNQALKKTPTDYPVLLSSR